jgi:Flp pilus assembly protein TadD
VAYYNLGNTYAHQGDYTQAIKSYHKAIEFKPDDAGAYNNLGNTYAHQGDYAQAMESYYKAIEFKPDDAGAYYNLGNTYAHQGDYAQAMESYHKAIEFKPDYASAYNNLGNTYAHQGDYAQAIKSYHKAIEFKPDDAVAYYNLGNTYAHQGDYTQAMESYHKAIELKPDNALAYYNLIELCQGRDDEYLDRVTTIFENHKKYFKMDIVYMMSLYSGIEKLIHKLLDTDYDDYFAQKLKKYDKIDKKSSEYATCKEIYLSSIKIMQLLHVNHVEETERGFAHYTRKIIAEKLLIKGKDSISPFRLNSILTSNDPTEGAVAFEYFGLKNKEKDRDYQAFIGCFTFDPECLNQFRLYGKDQGKEATGVSLVFKKEFFAEEPVGMASNLMAGKNEMEQDTKEYALYRCVYIDPETKQIIVLGHKDDYIFFRDKLDKLRKRKLSKVEKNGVDKEIIAYKEKINDKLQAVRKKFDALKRLIRRSKKQVGEELICDLLIDLRYLVKHIAFKEEQECRMVEIEKFCSYDKQGNRKVILDGDNMFINTRAIDNRLVERVYFAPSTPDMELFQEKLIYCDRKEITCHKCTHPIRIAKPGI